MAYNGKPSGITPGSYGDDTHVASVTVNDEGQITSVSSVGISTGGTGTVTSVGVSSTDLSVSGSPVTTSGSITLDLNASGVSADTYGDSTHVPQLTVNSKGVVTSVTNVAISSGGSGTVTSVGVSSTGGSVTVTGSPVTSSGTINVEVASSGVSASTYGDSTHIPQIAIGADGRITSASNIPISNLSYYTITNTSSSGYGSSAQATKGLLMETGDIGFSIDLITTKINTISAGTYIARVIELDGSYNIISVSSSNSVIAPSTATMSLAFHFSSPVTLSTSTKYGLCISRTDGGDTYSLPIANSNSGNCLMLPSSIIYSTSLTLAKATPSVSDTMGTASGVFPILGVRVLV